MPPPEKTPAHERFERVRDRAPQQARERLLDLPNVHAHGIGFVERDGERTDEVGIVIYVSEKVSESQLDDDEIAPDQINGVPTDVIEEPVPTAEAKGQRTRGLRPAGGGLTGGGENVTGGTLGTCLFEHDGEQVVVTARHTSCPDDQDCTLDTYLCPDQRWFDQERIGEVWKLGTWGDPDGNNIDAAVIRIDDPVDISSDFFAGAEMGVPDDGAILGRRYLNLGATTGVTSGTCVAKDVTANVNHSHGTETYNTTDRFDYATSPGDSGSAWVRFAPTAAPTRTTAGFGGEGYGEPGYGGAATGYGNEGYGLVGYGTAGRKRGVQHPTDIHIAGSEGGTSVGIPWHTITAEFGSFSVSSQSTIGQSEPEQSVAYFECAVYRAWISERTDNLHLETLITNTGGEYSSVTARILDGNDTTIGGPVTLDLRPFQFTTHTFTLSPARDGTTVYATVPNHTDEVQIQAEVISPGVTQSRYDGILRNIADNKAQHAGETKSVQRIAVNDSGTLTDLWTRST